MKIKKINKHYIITSTVFALALLANSTTADIKTDISADIMLDANSYRGYLFPEDAQEFNLRRIKAGVEIEFSPMIEAKISGKYNVDEEAKIDDLYVAITPSKNYQFLLGQFKEPTGMAKSESLKSQRFNERSLATNVFSFSRKPGIKLKVGGAMWRGEAALMHAAADEDGVDDGRAFALKASLNPYRSENKKTFIHVGAHYSTRDSIERRFDVNEPIIVPALGNLFRSPNYDAETIDTTGIEFAASYKGVLIQSEMFNQSIDEIEGDQYQQSGYYAELSWAAIGKAREYRKGKIKIASKKKPVLELAVRVSEVDTLNKGDGDLATVYSLSANYHYNKHLRMVLEYGYAEREHHNNTRVYSTDGDAITARFQYVL